MLARRPKTAAGPRPRSRKRARRPPDPPRRTATGRRTRDRRRLRLERAQRWTERRARSSERRSLSIQNVPRSIESDRLCLERITLSREGPTFPLQTAPPSGHPRSLCFESGRLGLVLAPQRHEGRRRSSVRGALSMESGARSLVCDARSRQRGTETRRSGSLWIESDPKCRSRLPFSLLRRSESRLRGPGCLLIVNESRLTVARTEHRLPEWRKRRTGACQLRAASPSEPPVLAYVRISSERPRLGRGRTKRPDALRARCTDWRAAEGPDDRGAYSPRSRPGRCHAAAVVGRRG
jgi:hypothetical protein